MRTSQGESRFGGAARAITMTMAAVVLAGLFAAVAALAATKTGTGKADTLNGTARADVLLGVGGNDKISGKGGADELSGGPGADRINGGSGVDTLLGGPGNDTLSAKDGAADTVNCGVGIDVATVDQVDEVSGSCEQVSGQVKEVAPTPPAISGEGPQGPVGPQGPQGPQPEPEEPGYDGALEETPISNVKLSAGWTGVGGIFSDQGGEPFEINGKSLRIQTDGVGTEAVGTSPQFDPVNLNKSHVSFHSRIEFGSRLDRVRLRLASDDDYESNYAEVTIWQSDFDPIILRSSFEFQSIPRGEFKIVGDVDWQSISRAQIILTDNDESALPVSVYVAGLYGVKTSETPIVSFGFDDGRVSTYNRGMRELAPYRFPATAYVIADSVGKANMITAEQLHTLEKQHHWEIAGHAMKLASHNEPSGLDSLSAEALKAEMDELRGWLTENGFPLESFAYPKGAAGPEVRKFVKRDYCAGRATAAGPETIPPRDNYTMRGYSINGLKEDFSAVKAKIDRGVADKAWTILTFHDIVDVTVDETTDFKTSEFAEVVAYVAQLQEEGKVKVRTTEAVLHCH